MIKFTKKKYKDNDLIKLNNKMFSVHVTNACNLHCGGCDQLCGHFDKEKIFFITLEELQKTISIFRVYRENWKRKSFPNDDKIFLLYGGEPTLHPKFNDILSILFENKDIPFCIYTNGRTFSSELTHIDLDTSQKQISYDVYKTKSLIKDPYPEYSDLFKRFHTYEKNVSYRIAYKTPEVKGEYHAVLCAPIDIEKEKLSKKEYWERAKKVCFKWNCCENSIYNGKAYVCNVAATMDHMFYDGKHGWSLQENSNPFDKTGADIEKQMKNFCYRCGYIHKGGIKGFTESTEKTQFLHKPSLITISNLTNMNNSPRKKELEVIQPVEVKVPKETFR